MRMKTKMLSTERASSIRYPRQELKAGLVAPLEEYPGVEDGGGHDHDCSPPGGLAHRDHMSLPVHDPEVDGQHDPDEGGEDRPQPELRHRSPSSSRSNKKTLAQAPGLNEGLAMTCGTGWPMPQIPTEPCAGRATPPAQS